LVTDDGQQLSTPGFDRMEVRQPALKQDKIDSKWPESFQVNLTLNLLTPPGGKARRPYVAVWIEDSAGKPVRTIAVWGNEGRWIKELYQWWKLHGNQPSLVKAVTRATRPPGKYTLVWDGVDDKGKAVDPGSYVVQVEVHREHGKHVRQTGTIECAKEPATIMLSKTAETDQIIVTYGPKGKGQ
jgi:thiamine biosynthesis lipoprotein